VNRCKRGKRVKPCGKWKKLRPVKRGHGRRGRNRTRFDGKVAGRRLPAGKYRLTIEARDGAGNVTRSQQLSFRVRAAR
jgi:hypothetical protein